jgi:predicted transcriptional regulator
MKTLTLKIPEILQVQLEAFARAKGLSRSEIIRRALREYISRDGIEKSGTVLELGKDLAGSVEGPSDLSVNETHLKDYGK